MTPPDDLIGVAVRLAEILEELGLPFAFGGAIAQNYWGTVRATQDVDILVACPASGSRSCRLLCARLAS